METIEMYKSKSGLICDTKEKAEIEDYYWGECQKILALLPSTDGINFSNGEGFLQCDADNVKHAKLQYLELTSQYFGQTFTNVNGIVGRWVSDSQSKAFNELQYKLSSIDEQNRLWGQIYYAIYPGRGRDIKLN